MSLGLVQAGTSIMYTHPQWKEKDQEGDRGRDVATEDLRLLEIDPEEAEEIARNRVQWKQIVEVAKGLNGPNAPGE